MRLVLFDLDGTLVHTGIDSAPESKAACALAQKGLTALQTRQYMSNVQAIMAEARRIGPTYIVTASNRAWMEAVTKCFAPAADTLISARDDYGQGSQAWQWKLRAFEALLAKHPNTTELLVIGDDETSEFRAARELKERHPRVVLRECVIAAPRTPEALMRSAHPQILGFLNRM